MEPALADDVRAADLDAGVRLDLRGLRKDVAESVARHLVATGSLVDEDPEAALAHARFARARAARIAAVREAVGIAAYHAGEWAEALAELRAARRMGGGPGHLAVMADIERALGRPERAIELSRSPEAGELDEADAVELAIVAAGARRDLGELDAAVVSLQGGALDERRRDPWSARLFYAYADNLLAAGRREDALRWFLHAADADDDEETDAADRIRALTDDAEPDPAAGDAAGSTVVPGADVAGDVGDPTAGDPRTVGELAGPAGSAGAAGAGHDVLDGRGAADGGASGGPVDGDVIDGAAGGGAAAADTADGGLPAADPTDGGAAAVETADGDAAAADTADGDAAAADTADGDAADGDEGAAAADPGAVTSAGGDAYEAAARLAESGAGSGAATTIDAEPSGGDPIGTAASGGDPVDTAASADDLTGTDPPPRATS